MKKKLRERILTRRNNNYNELVDTDDDGGVRYTSWTTPARKMSNAAVRVK